MLTLKNISKSFGTLKVLEDISLTVNNREIVAIVGPSGAGKTTLLLILGTLLAPEAGGSLCYDGTDLLTLNDGRLSAFRNRNIGFVFQAHRLLPEFSLVENVAMPALIAGRSKAEAFEAARRLLDTLGLGKRLDHRPAEMSGGECQRAAVARALINSPQVVFADEPSGSLDSRNRAELHRMFFELRDSLGATFVIVTHDDSLAADSDIKIRMADGRIASID